MEPPRSELLTAALVGNVQRERTLLSIGRTFDINDTARRFCDGERMALRPQLVENVLFDQFGKGGQTRLSIGR